jgi:hypothetical protein
MGKASTRARETSAQVRRFARMLGCASFCLGCAAADGTSSDAEGNTDTSERGVKTVREPLPLVRSAWVRGNDTGWDGFNPSGITNVVRTSSGNYRVEFHGMQTSGGNAQVVAFGSGNVRCKVQSWGPSSDNSYERMLVKCHGGSSRSADRKQSKIDRLARAS